MYIKFNCSLVNMSTFDMFDVSGVAGHDDGDHEGDYTSEDPVICLGDEKKYIRVKTNGRANQSCKRKRARPR